MLFILTYKSINRICTHLDLLGIQLNLYPTTQASVSQEGEKLREKNNREGPEEWKDETRTNCFRKYMLLSMLSLYYFMPIQQLSI